MGTALRFTLAVMTGAVIAAGASAQQQSRLPAPTRSEVWDLKLGAPAAALPTDFDAYACGTNGGPPSVPLSGWSDFRRCRPEASGLREVYFAQRSVNGPDRPRRRRRSAMVAIRAR